MRIPATPSEGQLSTVFPLPALPYVYLRRQDMQGLEDTVSRIVFGASKLNQSQALSVEQVKQGVVCVGGFAH